MKLKNYIRTRNIEVFTLFVLLFISFSCGDEDYVLPTSADPDLIKYIKKDYDAPVIVNNKIDFVFAIASKDGSSLNNFEITSNYPGNVTVDPKSYWTPTDGKTYSREMLTGISTSGKTTTGSVIDGIEWIPGIGDESGYSSKAVSIRYSYLVPEEVRGEKLKFDVKYTTKNGNTHNYSTIEYSVEKMDMVTDIVLTDPIDNSGKRYFSISEMKSYTLEEVESQNKSTVIDFVYRYNDVDLLTPDGNLIKLNTCIGSPSHDVYLSTDYVPLSWTKNSTLIEKRKWDDMQLKGGPPSNYVTDMDLENVSFTGNSFGEYNLAKDFGLVMQTADNKYRAFVYLKAVGVQTVTIGVKRLEL